MKIKTAKQCLDYCSEIQEFVRTLPDECIIAKVGILCSLDAIREELVFEMFSNNKRHAK